MADAAISKKGQQPINPWTYRISPTSPVMVQLRRPFRVVNALTGLGLAGFVGGVYFYSIYAVRQDRFEDVDSTPLPQTRELTMPPPRTKE